jgi:hypothetical protein
LSASRLEAQASSDQRTRQRTRHPSFSRPADQTTGPDTHLSADQRTRHPSSSGPAADQTADQTPIFQQTGSGPDTHLPADQTTGPDRADPAEQTPIFRRSRPQTRHPRQRTRHARSYRAGEGPDTPNKGPDIHLTKDQTPTSRRRTRRTRHPPHEGPDTYLEIPTSRRRIPNTRHPLHGTTPADQTPTREAALSIPKTNDQTPTSREPALWTPNLRLTARPHVGASERVYAATT